MGLVDAGRGGTVGTLGAAGGFFDVVPSDLLTGSANLSADSSAMSTHTQSVVAAATDAGGGCGDGGFAPALAVYTAASRAVGVASAEVISGNNLLLSNTAQRYLSDDSAATNVVNAAAVGIDAVSPAGLPGF